MENFLKNHSAILMEGAIVERIRHGSSIPLHPRLVNSALIYRVDGRSLMDTFYREYLDIARAAAMPMIICTPTWRANRERVTATNFPKGINQDNARFLKQIRVSYPEISLKIGGMLGCKNDCYRAEEALSATEAESFHQWQIDELGRGGVDFLIAETLPAVSEALGMGRAMSRTKLPYILSFTLDRNGRVLDGSIFNETILKLDSLLPRPPLGYMVNCAYPTFLKTASMNEQALQRLIGFQANASDLDQCELDGSCKLYANPVDDWGKAMMKIHQEACIAILGGCCGTDTKHIRYLADHLK